MGWSAWIPMGAPRGGFTGRPATSARNPEVTNIYVRGNDNKLWQRAYWNSTWHDWGRHDDGVLASAPSTGSMGPDHEHVFVRSTDGQVWQKWWSGPTGWSGWIALGAPPGGFRGGPVTISRNSSVCNVYVWGNDNALWQLAYWGGQWHDWGRHDDGVLASEPTVGSMGSDHEHVFVKGTDGNVWHKYWTAAEGWKGWFQLGSPPGGFQGNPNTISRNSTVANIYVRGNDNALWQKGWWDNQWHDWSRHDDGGVLADDPATSSRGADQEQMFIRGTDAQVWHKWWTSRLSSIDVNLIMVGRDNFTSANETQMVNSLTIARQIYAQVGLNIRNVSYWAITSAQAGTLEIIDSLAEADQLTDEWTVPNAALDVFVVRSMNGADGWSAVNGSCNKNADGMTGSVVSLNGDVGNSGNTFAHEKGHYLGLEHIADADNFIGNNGASNSNTNVYAWQGDIMKKHCFVFLA
jgi:Metallo-peptidase family M12B Reprolysin-like